VDFILPAVNQIVSEAAKIRYRSNNDWDCPITIRAPYGGGISGALYHSQSLEAMFNNQPGLKIVMPRTPSDVKDLHDASILVYGIKIRVSRRRLYSSDWKSRCKTRRGRCDDHYLWVMC